MEKRATEIIRKNQLIGYRVPTAEEKQEIWRLAERELRQECKFARRGSSFLWTVVGILAASVIYQFFARKESTIEMIIVAALALLTALVALTVTKGKIRKNLQNVRIREGNYQVLDAYSDRFDPNIDQMGKGMVMINDGNGNHCSESFMVDIELAKKYRGENHIPMLLVYEENSGYYRVFAKEEMHSR